MIRRLSHNYDEREESDGRLWVTLTCGHRVIASYKPDGEPRAFQECSRCDRRPPLNSKVVHTRGLRAHFKAGTVFTVSCLDDGMGLDLIGITHPESGELFWAPLEHLRRPPTPEPSR